MSRFHSQAGGAIKNIPGWNRPFKLYDHIWPTVHNFEPNARCSWRRTNIWNETKSGFEVAMDAQRARARLSIKYFLGISVCA